VWLTVVGVLENRDVTQGASQKFSIRNVNSEVYIPVNTMLMRFYNRSNLTVADIKKAAGEDDEEEEQPFTTPEENYHQLDRLVVNMTSSNSISAAVEVVDKILNRRHNEVDDYEIVVPELLLKQEQRTRKLFNIVLAVIAGISLLVGGIGIMNIMLVSVRERTREIGIRRAIGARQGQILTQFLIEAIVLSLLGGIIGVILGEIVAVLLANLGGWEFVLSWATIVAALGFAMLVGILFGVWPARAASRLKPVEALRFE
jgi:putative ABC transport system permease protein